MSVRPLAPSPSLHHIVRPSRGDDVPSIGALLAAACQDDPVVSWILPDDQGRRALLPTLMQLLTARFQPQCANQVNETRTAAAVWAPPGAVFTHEDDHWFDEELAAVVGDAAARAGELMAVLDAHDPRDPHHHLMLLGVAPAHQGAGIGSALLRAVLDRADRAGEGAYTVATTPRIRTFHERHGFEVTRELHCADSPPLWAMWRDPFA
jgi:GNAT superfamily N-acetyltransferase